MLPSTVTPNDKHMIKPNTYSVRSLIWKVAFTVIYTKAL